MSDSTLSQLVAQWFDEYHRLAYWLARRWAKRCLDYRARGYSVDELQELTQDAVARAFDRFNDSVNVREEGSWEARYPFLVHVPGGQPMMTDTISEVVETKVCKDCAEAWPITEFRLRRRGGEDRMNLCRLCHNGKERARQQKKERALRHSVAKDYVRKLLRREGNMDDLTDTYARQLGNVKRLAQAITEYLDVETKRTPSVRVG